MGEAQPTQIQASLEHSCLGRRFLLLCVEIQADYPEISNSIAGSKNLVCVISRTSVAPGLIFCFKFFAEKEILPYVHESVDESIHTTPLNL